MPNAHLSAMVRSYNEARDAIVEIQNRARAENRAPTAAEQAMVESQTRTCDELAPQIEAAAVLETRSRAVNAAAAAVAAGEQVAGTGTDGAASGEQTRGQALDGGPGVTSSTTTRQRDPGHYRSAATGGQHSFFADLVRSREGDEAAAARLVEHSRALSTGVSGTGVVPPRWISEEYDAIARQGRVVSAGVRLFPLGTDPRPITLPKQTGGTDAVVAEQATENTHPSETDAFATNVDTVTPKPTSGMQVVSRQMLEMSNPAADALIYGDMLAVYNRKVEDKVCAALLAAAGAPVATFATEAAFGAGQAASDAVIDAAFAVWGARKLPADSVAMRIPRWGRFNKLRDLDGRKLYPSSDAGPMNVDGIGSVQSAGNVEGLVVHPTDGLGSTAYPESVLVYRAADTILFESDVQRFRFEEVAGPESVKIGIWGYTAVLVRQAANSVRRIQITAAS